MNKNELLNAGLKNFASGDLDKAIDFLNQALVIDDKFILAYNALAQCYNQIGNLEKALEMAKNFAELAPEDPIAHTALSRLYVQKGMIEEAEKELALSNHLAHNQ